MTALARFQSNGGEVFIATGRSADSAERYHRALGLRTPAILYNGARVVDMITREVLYSKVISDYGALGEHVVGALPENIGAVAFTDREAVVVHDAPSLRGYARRDQISLIRPSRHIETAEFVKVLFVSDRPEIEGLAHQIAKVAPELVVVRSEPTYLEVLPPGVSKGEALAWLASSRGIGLERVAAVGDNFNDLDMIRRAHIGAVPASADAGLRQYADLVVARCEDGAVADLVDHVMEAIP